MTLLKRWWWRIGATLRPRNHDEEFRAEIESHFQCMVDERMARGMSEQAARREAHLKLGGIAQIEELHREWRSVGWLEGTLRDCRQAQRSLRRDPRFVLIALAVIALGVGAGTAVFSVVQQAFFRQLPYDHPERLVSVGMTLPWVDQEFLFGRAYAQLAYSLSPLFAEATSAVGVQDCELDLTGLRKRLPCAKVEASFLRVLGVRPAVGRDITDADDQPESPPVVLLSHHLWAEAYGADQAVIGRTVTLDETPTRVIGVLPRNFEMPSGETVALLVPQKVDMQQQSLANPGRPLRVIARLSDGTTPFAASAAIRTMLPVHDAPTHARDAMTLRIRPIRDLRFRDKKLALGFLTGSAACLFLTTCANVGFLLLARAAARRRERQIRIALGAGSVALLRQSLAEALFLSLPGSLLGLALAGTLLHAAVPFIPATLLETGQIQIDRDALLFAASCVLLASFLFGFIPMLGDRGSYSLNANRPAGTTLHGNRLRQALVVSQIAICIALVGTAATLLHSLWQLRAEGRRFDRERITTASFILSRGAYSSAEEQTAFFRQLEQRLISTRVFKAVGISDSIPPSGTTRSHAFIALQPVHVGAEAVAAPGGLVLWRFVTPGYFDAMRIRVVKGRTFAASDISGAPVVVVNETLARRLFADGVFAGQTIRTSGVPCEVIGIVEDIRNDAGNRHPQPEYYVLRQPAVRAAYENQAPPYGWRRASLVVRSSLGEHVAKSVITEELKRLAPEMETTVETMAQRFDAISEKPRFQAATLVCFGVVGLLLAAVGVYGLVDFLVAERTREFAVRLALGANGRQIQKLVLGLAVRWTVWGAVTGTLLALAAARVLQRASHEIVRTDSIAYALATAVLALVCVSAAWFPTIRAGRADPAVTLREQ